MNKILHLWLMISNKKYRRVYRAIKRVAKAQCNLTEQKMQRIAIQNS